MIRIVDPSNKIWVTRKDASGRPQELWHEGAWQPLIAVVWMPVSQKYKYIIDSTKEGTT